MLRRFRRVDCVVPVARDPRGHLILEHTETVIDEDMDVSLEPCYECENCGRVLFHDILEIEDLLEKEDVREQS